MPKFHFARRLGRRAHAPLRLLGAVVFCGPIAAFLAAHIWGSLLPTPGREPPRLANSAANVSDIVLSSKGAVSGWKFAVVGDLGRTYGIFLRALSDMKERDARFVVIAGDSVYSKTAEQYEYLQLKIAQARFDRPIFAALGNEDVAAPGDYRLFRHYLKGPNAGASRKAEVFIPFGRDYTERFAFLVPATPPYQAIFVFFDNAFAAPADEQIAWLEKILDEYRKQVRYAFLVSHQPVVQTHKNQQKVSSREYLRPYERSEAPKGAEPGTGPYELIGIDPGSQIVPVLRLPTDLESPAVQLPEPLRADYRRFYALLKKHKITAVFSGHIHGYARYQLGETDHFVSGGGGARLQYPEALHHYLEVVVGEEGVEVRPRLLHGSPDLAAKIERFMMVEIFLVFRNRPWLYGPAVLWIVSGVWLCYWRGQRRLRDPRGSTS